MDTAIVYWGIIGMMANKMETTLAYWGYMGRMEEKMETTILLYCMCSLSSCVLGLGSTHMQYCGYYLPK